ncbi:MAG: hypothetical protein P1V97_00410 [Planctomycetota bacterium]|nr:hypothetical protein [Planctomycetota bacterium]
MRIFIFICLLFLCQPVFGDIILLKNGRTVRGQVVSISEDRVSMRIPGGTIEFSRALVKTITRQSTKAEEIAEQFEKVKSDPNALDKLSLKAAAAGLHSQSVDIKGLADGLRLERRLESIRDSKDPQDYLSLFRWTQLAGYSITVQKFVVEKALKLDPKNGLARLALKQLRQEEVRAQAEAKRLKSLKKTPPRKTLPKKRKAPVAKRTDPVAAPSKRDLEKARKQAKRDLEELKRLQALLRKERLALEREQAALERRRRASRARSRNIRRRRR